MSGQSSLVNDLVNAIVQLRSEVIQLKQTIGGSDRRLGDSLYLGDNTVLTTLADGHRMYVDSMSVDIGFHLINGGRWEPNYVSSFLSFVKPGQTVFDIGANHGVYTLAAARAVGQTGKVYAFEANPRFAQLVSLSSIINGYRDRVEVLECAVGQEKGTAEFEFDQHLSGGGSLFLRRDADKNRKRVQVNVERIDDLVGRKVEAIDVLKMDVEGYEGCVMLGMDSLLRRSPDIKIITEWSKTMLDSSPCNAARTASIYESFGMKAWVIGQQSDYQPIEWNQLANEQEALRNIYVSRHAPSDNVS